MKFDDDVRSKHGFVTFRRHRQRLKNRKRRENPSTDASYRLAFNWATRVNRHNTCGPKHVYALYVHIWCTLFFRNLLRSLRVLDFRHFSAADIIPGPFPPVHAHAHAVRILLLYLTLRRCVSKANAAANRRWNNTFPEAHLFGLSQYRLNDSDRPSATTALLYIAIKPLCRTPSIQKVGKTYNNRSVSGTRGGW